MRFEFEIGQARPEATRQLSRQSVIGMLLIFGGATYFIHVTNCVPRSSLGQEIDP